MHAELDALELEVEEEGPSYLADLNKVPDYLDEEPVSNVGEVKHLLYCETQIGADTSIDRPMRNQRQ